MLKAAFKLWPQEGTLLNIAPRYSCIFQSALKTELFLLCFWLLVCHSALILSQVYIKGLWSFVFQKFYLWKGDEIKFECYLKKNNKNISWEH